MHGHLSFVSVNHARALDLVYMVDLEGLLSK